LRVAILSKEEEKFIKLELILTWNDEHFVSEWIG
jgi:hypothetical protein